MNRKSTAAAIVLSTMLALAAATTAQAAPCMSVALTGTSGPLTETNFKQAALDSGDIVVGRDLATIRRPKS